MSGTVYDLLITKQDGLPKPFFHGRAFEGSDLVIGNGGWKKRVYSSARQFKPEEGAYIYCYGEKGERHIETDPFGFCKLYFYQSGTEWAISDSVVLLCEWAHENELPVSIHRPALGFLRSAWDIGDQPMSHQTLFEQINLVPIWSRIRVIGSDIELVKSRHYESLYLDSTYEDALRGFITRSRNRLLTILSSENVDAHFQISGGIDSRVIISLVHSLGIDYSMYTKNAAGLEVDQKIANLVATKLGVNLGVEPRRLPFYDYSTWRKQRLSTFKIFYFKRDSPDDVLIIGGGCGELYRRRYEFDYRLLGKYSGHKVLFNGDLKSYYAAFREFESECLYSKSQLFGDVPFGKSYYRALRHRFHYGQDAVFKPFADLRFTSFIDRMYNGQRNGDYRIYHEIIAALTPELLDIEFDDEKKACTGRNRNEMFWLKDIPSASPGKVWIGNEISDRGEENSIDEFIKHMKIDFEIALENVPLLEFMTEAEILEAKDKLNQFEKAGKIPPRVLRLVHFILALGLAYPSNSINNDVP